VAKSQRRKSSLFGPSNKRAKGRKRWSLQNSIVNSAIAILSLLLIAFIFSFSRQYTQKGVPIKTTFPSLPDQTRLAVEIYEQNPVLDIEVEVLNGCGEAGLAGKVSEFLRNNRIDVVRSENADHFGYDRTLLIQRNEKFENLKTVSATLGFDLNDKSRVLVQPDANSDVDLTLIIGKDYKTIRPLTDFLNHKF